MIELMVTKDEKIEFSKRLNLVLDRVGVPPKGKGRQKAVAHTFNVSQKGARKWLEGEAIPETKRIPEFIRAYKKANITGEWLLYGNPEYAPDWFSDETKELSKKIANGYEFKRGGLITPGDIGDFDGNNLPPKVQAVINQLSEGFRDGSLKLDDFELIAILIGKITKKEA